MVKLSIEDEFCLLLLIKGPIQHAKVTDRSSGFQVRQLKKKEGHRTAC